MLALFDTETTGFTQGHIVELAAFIVAPNGENWNWYSKCKPSSPIEDSAAEVHGITDFEVKDERPDTEVVPEFWADINLLADDAQSQLILAGHNSLFDVRMIRKYVKVPEDTPVICTMRLGRLYSPDAPDHKLVTLHSYLGLSGNYIAHSAMDDVYMSYNILLFYAKKYGLSYRQMAETLRKPIRLQTMPFGKHKGLPMSVIPISYMNYMLGLGDLDSDVRFSFLEEIKRR